MKLHRLELGHFRQHVQSELTFDSGLTGIIGPNGAGKSTIVEGIIFALFGTRALRGKIEDLVTRGAQRGEKGRRKSVIPEVTLSFEHDGVVYRIERTTEDALLYAGGESAALATGNRDVTRRVETLIAMTQEEFLATYCTEQKGLEFLSGRRGATEREKFIVRMMGYHRLEEMQELLREERKEKRGTFMGYEASLGSREEIEKRIETEKVTIVEERKKQSEARTLLEKSEKRYEELRGKFDLLEERRSRHNKLSEEVSGNRVKIEERAARLRSIQRDREKLASIRSLEPIMRELAGARETVERTEADLSAWRVTSENEERSWRDQQAHARTELQQLEAKQATATKQLQSRGKLRGTVACPTCGQPLGTSFEKAREHLEAELATLEGAVQDARRVATERDVIPPSIAALRERGAVLQKSLNDTRAVLEALRDEERESMRLEGLNELERTVLQEQKTLQKAQAAFDDRLAAVRHQEDAYLREKGALDSLQRLIEVSRLQKVRIDGEVSGKEQLLERSTQELLRYDEKRGSLEMLRTELRILDESDHILTDFRRHVNGMIRPRLAELASSYIADLTDGRYTAVDLAPDFAPTVLEDGEPKPVISGGEADVLNLVLRLALSHMLAERAGQAFSFLILDEVLGALDEGRRNNVLGLLEKLVQRFDQIMVITHLEDVKESVEHLMVIDYDEGKGMSVVSSGLRIEEGFDSAVNI